LDALSAAARLAANPCLTPGFFYHAGAQRIEAGVK
jgi:hypothetical protein